MPRPRRPLLHYTVRDRGPDAEWAVLIHGAGVTSEIWDLQVDDYAREYNLVLPELRGHGRSGALADGRERHPYTWEEVSRDVLDVMDHLGIDTAHLVAVSMGSIVARTITAMAPERVQSMVLPGAVVRLNPFARLLLTVARSLKSVVPYMWLYAINAWIIMPRPSHGDSRRVVIRQARQLGQAEFRRWLRATDDIRERLRRYAARDPGIPTLYVMGGQDFMFLPGAGAVAEAHDSARLHVVEGCGHVCTVERPEHFNRVSLEFLRGL